MREKTFLLFKPNQFFTVDVYQYILNQLKEDKLIVDNEYSVKLTSWQLCNLWPLQCKDRLLYYAMEELYADFIKVIEVCGNNAIKKVNKIKKRTRLIYATGVIRNCIHAPASLDEYNEQIKVIHNQYSSQKLVFDDLAYTCYRYLNEDMCKELAKYIIDISLYTMIHATIPYENSTNRFRYYLVEDEMHSFTDYVCFIYDSFSEFDFRMSCVLATMLKSYGEVCLIDTNEEKNADTLVRNGIIHNMTIKRHEIIKL